MLYVLQLSHVEVNPLADDIDLPLSDYNNNCHPLSPGFFLNHQSPCAEVSSLLWLLTKTFLVLV